MPWLPPLKSGIYDFYCSRIKWRYVPKINITGSNMYWWPAGIDRLFQGVVSRPQAYWLHGVQYKGSIFSHPRGTNTRPKAIKCSLMLNSSGKENTSLRDTFGTCWILLLFYPPISSNKMRISFYFPILLAPSALAGDVLWSGIFNSSFSVADFDKCSFCRYKPMILSCVYWYHHYFRVLLQWDWAMAMVYPRQCINFSLSRGVIGFQKSGRYHWRTGHQDHYCMYTHAPLLGFLVNMDS